MGTATLEVRPAIAEASGDRVALRLLDDVELLGRMSGSGLREPPYLIRRPDGQVVQVSELLFVVARHAGPGRSEAEIVEDVGADLDVRVQPEQLAFLLEHKLHPLGILSGPDGSAPQLKRLAPMFGLQVRKGVIPARAVNAVAEILRHLFRPVAMVPLLSALLTFDLWLVAVHGLGSSVSQVIQTPTLALVLFLLTFASLVFHECGHAAACRYGGGRPGAIGVGLYIVWPALYTDVTDSYRLDRRGRIRTDVGGMYFNLVFALAVAGVYVATGFEPLLIAIVAQHVMAVNQFIPWLRLDGYYVVSDLIGVADLFQRIGPVLRSVHPRRRADPRVAELKRWARSAVIIWVVTTVAVLVSGLVFMVLHASPFLEQAWISLQLQVDVLADAVSAHRTIDALNAGLSALLLVLPVLGVFVTYLMICRTGGSMLAVWRYRAAIAEARRQVLVRS